MNRPKKLAFIVLGACAGALPYIFLSLLADNIDNGIRWAAIAIPCVLLISLVWVASHASETPVRAFGLAAVSSFLGTSGSFFGVFLLDMALAWILPQPQLFFDHEFDFYKFLFPLISLAVSLIISRLMTTQQLAKT